MSDNSNPSAWERAESLFGGHSRDELIAAAYNYKTERDLLASRSDAAGLLVKPGNGTAEEVVDAAITDWYRNGGTSRDDTLAEYVTLRVASSPAALADLNGGEWVQTQDATEAQWRASKSYVFVPHPSPAEEVS